MPLLPPCSPPSPSRTPASPRNSSLPSPVDYNVVAPFERTLQPLDAMPTSTLGEFEQLVLLAILQQGDTAFGLEVRAEIERKARRGVSRGAFYTTLDRLEKKGYLTWAEAVPADPSRTAPLRRFQVTPAGIAALRESRRTLQALSRGLEDILEEA